MPAKKNTHLLVFLSTAFFVSQLWCAPTGKITGKITDAQTGEPLPGANVLIEGTSLGAATDISGEYTILNVPAGHHTMRISYVGYKTVENDFQLNEGESLSKDLKLEAVGVQGQEVVVTAQAQGQNAAINQQLSAMQIANVVSAARIKELPDANAAESVGRLPGVFLVRSYGEGSQVAIRGLAPQYNQVLVDGVPIPANESGSDATGGGRGVDMSMISSDMLSGIELYKTVTPDMDAAVLGGTVNFQIREARGAPSGAPALDFRAQGGYDNLQDVYNDYLFSGTIEKRYLDNHFGILAQGTIERKNLTADIFGGSYNQAIKSYTNLGSVIMTSLNLLYKPTERQRYDGTFVLDYKWDDGKVDLMNFLSKGTQSTETFSQNYNFSGGGITYGASQFAPVTNVITNILDFQQNVLSFKMDIRASHAYTENVNPDYWSVTFSQPAALSRVDQTKDPVIIAQQASVYADSSKTFLSGLSNNNSFTRQRNIAGSIGFEKNINLSDLITADLKFGGNFHYTFRSYDYNSGSGGNLDNYAPSDTRVRAAVIAANPWMAQWLESHGRKTDGSSLFPIMMFFDPSNDFGKFLGGDYQMLWEPTNVGNLSQVVNSVVAYQEANPDPTVGNAYSPDMKASIENDYFGYEYQNAAYVMATVNFGPRLTLIPGVRYQGLRTLYTAAYIDNYGGNNSYPYVFPHIDTTVTEYHGYWLPDISLRYRAFSWFDARLSYTNTLSYPSFQYLAPEIHIDRTSSQPNVQRWNNFMLKPATSQNYDLALSFYNNSIGLFTVNPFLKQIDNFIFEYGGYGITDPSIYPLPAYTKNYILENTQINNSNRVNLWGIELDWQTHFWYLPSLLSGLVMNVNYTHIFSQAKYPIHFSETKGIFPNYHTVEVDTFYTARLIDQPSNIVNLSIGYDYRGFSARASMIYQADIFNATNFWPALRQSKSTYTRWDFSAKQNLPWFGLQLYFDLINLNGEPDITVIQGSGFPDNENSYGLTADLGLRWNF